MHQTVSCGPHEEVLTELIEWTEDLVEGTVSSRMALLAAPERWGRTTVLTTFMERVGRSTDPHHEVAVVHLPLEDLWGEGPGVQAGRLREILLERQLSSKTLRLLGVLDLDTGQGRLSNVLALLGLAAPPLSVLAWILATGTGAHRRVAQTLDRQARDVARQLGYRLSALAASAPVVVVVDDVDGPDSAVATAFIEAALSRPERPILVIATCEPGAQIVCDLRDPGRAVAERVTLVDVTNDMDPPHRRAIVAEAAPEMTPEAIATLVRNTDSFADVLTVLGAPSIADAVDDAGSMDTLISSMLQRGPLTAAETLVAFFGGALPKGALSELLPTDYGTGLGQLRVRDGVAQLPRRADAAAIGDNVGRFFSAEEVDAIAVQILALVPPVDAPPGAVVASERSRQAAARRLGGQEQLLTTTLDLAAALHEAGRTGAALTTLDELVAASLTSDQRARESLLRTQIAAAMAELPPSERRALLADRFDSASLTGAEAATWQAIDGFLRYGNSERARALSRAAADTLDLSPTKYGDLRLQLAFHLGDAEPALTQRILAPLLAAPESDSKLSTLAFKSVLLSAGSRTDLRLQLIELQTELEVLGPSAAPQEQYRLHKTLAGLHARLGEFGDALHHGHLSHTAAGEFLGPDHPETLAIRHDVAHWTGKAGDPILALDLYTVLIPDRSRVLGPDHPSTLATRHNLAYWAGEAGNPREALKLFLALLPDRTRVLGTDAKDTLSTRHNIARWAGEAGNTPESLKLFIALLPDLERVLGPDQPLTLTARQNVAHMVGAAGNPAAALELSLDLLRDLERVLGPDHPDTLTTRHNIAGLTGQLGDPVEALQLYQALLIDRMRVLGPDHPDCLTTRHNMAQLTGETGDPVAAAAGYRALVPDLERALGPDHPHTLTTRHFVAEWTGKAGDPDSALGLHRALLSDLERVLGPDHPHTVGTRNAIADWPSPPESGELDH